MKRSYETDEEELESKCSRTESISYEISSESEIVDNSCRRIEEETFEPNNTEKQIIRQALSMIMKTNMSDWLTDIPGDKIVLRNQGVVIEGTDIIFCDILVTVIYGDLYTHCVITYYIGGTEDTLFLRWDTEFVGDYEDFDTISIYKYFNKTSYWIFNKKERKVCKIIPRDENFWGFFADARLQLNKIA